MNYIIVYTIENSFLKHTIFIKKDSFVDCTRFIKLLKKRDPGIKIFVYQFKEVF